MTTDSTKEYTDFVVIADDVIVSNNVNAFYYTRQSDHSLLSLCDHICQLVTIGQ